jgi:sporulation protein YlmC with PRC-barrel domain
MKTILLCGATLAILGVAIAPISAQTQSTTTSTSTTYIQASKLIGTKVKAAQGDDVGEIKDVVLDQNGCMAYTVVSTGGSRLTGSSKTVAVPWSVYSATSDPRVYTVRVEKEKIYSAPVFEYSRINEYSSSGWITNVYSHYGVSPSVGVGMSVGGGVSGSATTTTGSTTTGSTTTGVAGATGATGTPAAAVSPSASPLPTATASPAVSAAPTASVGATPSASVSPSASASPTRRTNRGETATGKTKAETTPGSGRHHTEETTGEKSEASPSAEGTSSSGERTKKARRHSTEGSSAEESATPKSTPEQE